MHKLWKNRHPKELILRKTKVLYEIRCRRAQYRYKEKGDTKDYQYLFRMICTRRAVNVFFLELNAPRSIHAQMRTVTPRKRILPLQLRAGMPAHTKATYGKFKALHNWRDAKASTCRKKVKSVHLEIWGFLLYQQSGMTVHLCTLQSSPGPDPGRSWRSRRVPCPPPHRWGWSSGSSSGDPRWTWSSSWSPQLNTKDIVQINFLYIISLF